MSDEDKAAGTAYSDIVLKELKDISEAQKDTGKNVTELLDRIKTIEMVVIGIGKGNSETSLLSRVSKLENCVTELQAFKIKAVTIFVVVQAVLSMAFAVTLKLIQK